MTNKNNNDILFTVYIQGASEKYESVIRMFVAVLSYLYETPYMCMYALYIHSKIHSLILLFGIRSILCDRKLRTIIRLMNYQCALRTQDSIRHRFIHGVCTVFYVFPLDSSGRVK